MRIWDLITAEELLTVARRDDNVVVMARAVAISRHYHDAVSIMAIAIADGCGDDPGKTYANIMATLDMIDEALGKKYGVTGG